MGGFRRKSAPPPPPPAAAPVTAATKQVDEEAPSTMETAGEGLQKRRGKRKLRTPVTQTAGTNVGGEGSSGLQIPKG
tara:strand:+ start:2385 stop:2615 length:231 start_codon:yes stop_codon:yes gene_type:complete